MRAQAHTLKEKNQNIFSTCAGMRRDHAYAYAQLNGADHGAEEK